MKKASVSLLNPGNIIKQKWMKSLDEDDLSINFIIDHIKNQIDNVSSRANMLLLRASTGSGKSTVLPVHLYKKFAELGRANILVSQPTRITTMDIPLGIIKYNPGFNFEENIGYQTGVLARKPRKGIIFVTIGILLQYFKIMSDDDICKKFGFIVIDEIHNRSIDMDQTLSYIKSFNARINSLKNNNRIPFFILMSATFHPEIYMDYFNLKKEQFIDVRGISYPIEKHFASFDITNYVSYILDLIIKIHVENLNDLDCDAQTNAQQTNAQQTNVRACGESPKHILVFLQGASVIKEVALKLHDLNKNVLSKGRAVSKQYVDALKKTTGGATERSDWIEILPISLLSESISKGSEDYVNLYAVTSLRKVILATNVVETGITIPSLKYVIDSGMVKEVSFNPNFGCTTIMDKNINQSSARQRIGRVGRNAPGVGYYCYTEDTYSKFYANTIPDILKEDISPFMLNVIIQETKTELVESGNNIKGTFQLNRFQLNRFEQKYYEITSEKNFNGELNLITPPGYDAYIYAIEKLHNLGFIDNNFKPTLYGLYANKIRKLRLENIRMIFAGYHFDGVSVLDLITIACMTQVFGTELKLDVRKNDDDFINYLMLWNDYGAQKIDSRVIELRDEVIENFLLIGLNPYYGSVFDSNKDSMASMDNTIMKDIKDTSKISDVSVISNSYEKQLKLCIREGYRLNSCTWNERLRMYILDYYHYPITVNFSSELVPQRIIVSTIALQSNKKSKDGLYKFVGKDISFT